MSNLNSQPKTKRGYIMAEQTNEWMTAAPSTGDAFQILEAGAYDAICVGLVRKEFRKYKSEEMEPKFMFIFQINDGDVNHYVRSLPMRNVINDKSNLFVFLNGWTGVTLEKCASGIDMGKLVGCKAQVVVGEAERDGKKFNTIETVLKCKKSSTVSFVKDDKAPAWLNKGLLGSHWIDGLDFAEVEAPKPEFTDDDLVKLADSKAEPEVACSSDDADGLPF
jgi:hypothetical protein